MRTGSFRSAGFEGAQTAAAIGRLTRIGLRPPETRQNRRRVDSSLIGKVFTFGVSPALGAVPKIAVC